MDIITDTDLHSTAPLDLFSISQENSEICHNHAPYLCIPEHEGVPGHLAQGCCNDWTCPRCGDMRARHEYGRIVEGARQQSDLYPLWFLTLTCRGDISQAQAENTYLECTNRFLTTFRYWCGKWEQHWSYAAVTERQERGAPHSHFLCTMSPPDAFEVLEDYKAYKIAVKEINGKIPRYMRFTADKKENVKMHTFHSSWLMLNAQFSGLGVQARISAVDSVEACSRYVAKYLFKQTMTDVWPKKWRRVRYSQNWPKLPERHNPLAFPILSAWDWYLAADSGILTTQSYTVYERAIRQGLGNVIFKPRKLDTVSN